jgi:U3 small nucleolar ribonucleoprotein component
MKKKTGWDLAIQDAKDMISAFEKKIKRLRESIEVFEQDRDQGKNWPGDGEREAAALKREVAAQS